MAMEEVPRDSLSKVSKKQKQLDAGRLKLEEFRKKKAEEKRNKDKGKPLEKIINKLPAKDIVANGSKHDSTHEGNVTSKISTILPHDNHGFLDANFQINNAEHGENKLEETVGSYVRTTDASDSINAVLRSSNNASEPIESFRQPSSNESQNTSEFIEKSSIYGNTSIHEPSAWARGFEKAKSIPDMKDLIGSGRVLDVQNESLFDRSRGIPILKEKETGSMNIPWDRKDQLRSPFQSRHKPDGMKSESSEHLQSLAAKSNIPLSFPYRSPLEPPMLKNHISPLDQRSDTSSHSSHDLSSSFVSLDRERIDHFGKNMNKFEKSQVSSHNDDFAALEQHIDELTQEKYLLQRTLDAQKSLSESLSQQNTALTEDFNYQATVINELREDLEKKREELAAQSSVLSSLMIEREKAQQENNSALERSQILAGEVISLEEKVLKLRSSELKLQRELESLKSENGSYRGQSAALEKDRQNLRSMLEALQEDKKLLQAHLQQNLVNDGSKTTVVERRETREVSTSTDFETNELSNINSLQPHGDMHNISTSMVIPSQHHQLGYNMMSTGATLSSDETRLINNIDLLITELVTEKESLLEMLRKQFSEVSELQILNTELSKKLELQTQRLELVVTQNMANGVSGDVTNLNEAQEAYFVDEGDEVVERVLGWIMRLFPGGSSRRRTSKLL